MFSKLISFCLLFLTSTFAHKLQLSTDDGLTWKFFDSPLLAPPQMAIIRLVDKPSTVLRLPSCAFEGSLRVQVWRTKTSDKPIGLRWQSSVCHPHLTIPNGIVVEHIAPQRHKPDWLDYLRQQTLDDVHVEPDAQQEKGFFSKYSLYIMIFIGIALGQGIRQGLAELREEMEREEREQKEKNAPGQIRVVVPKRKMSAKTRKKATPFGTKK